MIVSNEEYAVDIQDVVKIFPNPAGGYVSAVDHVSLKIPYGEFFSLLGPSGCGKTTSLRLIAGFEWPSQGEVYIKNKAMGRTPPYLRPVNTVFQSYALFQHMNVYQNVAFGLEMDHVPKDEIKRRVEEVLGLVQLSGMGPRKPKQLSGGQQQRVALARALVKKPTVLLLDEPLGALDLKLRKEMQLELKALQIQVGITFVYVTHDQEEALTMSDRIAVMNKGKVLQVGSPFEIYERPNCRFVADFIGETNFLQGIVKRVTPDRIKIYVKELEAEVIGRSIDKLTIGQSVTISIRPEKIRISESRTMNENCFSAKVVSTTYIGSDTRMVIELTDNIRLKVWEQNKISTMDPQAFYRNGQIVWITIFPENTFVMPTE